MYIFTKKSSEISSLVGKLVLRCTDLLAIYTEYWECLSVPKCTLVDKNPFMKLRICLTLLKRIVLRGCSKQIRNMLDKILPATVLYTHKQKFAYTHSLASVPTRLEKMHHYCIKSKCDEGYCVHCTSQTICIFAMPYVLTEE